MRIFIATDIPPNERKYRKLVTMHDGRERYGVASDGSLAQLPIRKRGIRLHRCSCISACETERSKIFACSSVKTARILKMWLTVSFWYRPRAMWTSSIAACTSGPSCLLVRIALANSTLAACASASSCERTSANRFSSFAISLSWAFDRSSLLWSNSCNALFGVASGASNLAPKKAPPMPARNARTMVAMIARRAGFIE